MDPNYTSNLYNYIPLIFLDLSNTLFSLCLFFYDIFHVITTISISLGVEWLMLHYSFLERLKISFKLKK